MKVYVLMQTDAEFIVAITASRLRAEEHLKVPSTIMSKPSFREYELEDEAVNNHARLVDALEKAYKELNEIHARDGVPYTSDGWKASVTQEYFTSVVEQAREALRLAGSGAA